METHRQSQVMEELEEMRAEQARQMTGLSVEEIVRRYRDEGEKAKRELGIVLPRYEDRQKAAA